MGDTLTALTRGKGWNYMVKLLTCGTCTVCSADAGVYVIAGGYACTMISGLDSVSGLKASKPANDVSSFEDTMDQNVAGRPVFGPVTISGTYDSCNTNQKAIVTSVFHTGTTASADTLRWFQIKDTINKRRHYFKGWVSDCDIGVTVKGKVTFSAVIVPVSKIQVCTSAT